VSLEAFSPATRGWFEASFAEPTRAQRQGWDAIASGDHTLICAPTGSGKTLAAFLWAIDRMSVEPPPQQATERTRVLYISPLRALAVDIEKNLRAPLTGIAAMAERLTGSPLPHLPTVGVRTGDTPANERRAMLRRPSDILITTPESLYLLLTSSARETLRGVEWVIVDEIHALAATKRGAHLALSLERLDALVTSPGDGDGPARPSPRRIGLSATQRPLSEIARFLGGSHGGTPRPVTIVDAGHRKPMELQVVVPVEDMGRLGELTGELTSGSAAAAQPARTSIWPSIHPQLVELIRAHRSTMVFVNARQLAERLASRLNDLAGEDLVKAHHGSIAREQRLEIEDELKSGKLRAIVATSSLELGIDMGDVDLVIQVGSPGSVSRGLQRIGRAGHHVGEPSRGTIFPKYRGDLLEAAVVAERMLAGDIEETRYPRNPLDVLAQQIVATTAVETWQVDDLLTLVRGAANFEDLSEDVFLAVLDLLAGRYPSDLAAGLRPRVVWDRARGSIRAREGAGRIAITNGGTIPDRGLFGVFLAGEGGTRVGELDEEMVFESRAGEVFLLGASSWRIEEITRDRVVVTPAPGVPGKMPFWKGDGPGRPVELGRAIGAFTRELRGRGRDAAVQRLRADVGLDDLAAANLIAFLEEQHEATGAVPDDRTIVAERFRDEVGDWRLCILSPLGARVHAPWALAIEARLTDRFGPGAQVLWSDDGITVRFPEAVEEIPIDDLVFDPDTIEDEVVRTLPGTALFASLFREASARALLLPRQRPGKRTPLWQQRQRGADLLAEAAQHPTFPMLLETTRECLRDVFDIEALREVMAGLRSRRIKLVSVDTEHASPFARSLMFRWIAVFMYEGDAPLAERRVSALTLDRDLLRELLGTDELRELLDPAALDEIELELQRVAEGYRARSLDDVHDLLRTVGDLTDEELAHRTDGDPSLASIWAKELVEEGRAIRVRVGGQERLAAAEDAGLLRDALGIAIPLGLPGAFTVPVELPLDALVARYARTHGPFVPADVAERFAAASADRIEGSLQRLETAGRTIRGGFRPGGHEIEWCDAEVLRRVRSRSLAVLRKEVEPVEAPVLGRFLPAWQGADKPSGDPEALLEAIGRLQGTAIFASILETDVLPARVRTYRPADLDALCASGEVVWTGAGGLPGTGDGRIVLCFREQARLLLEPTTDVGGDAYAAADRPSDELHEALRRHLAQAGASFWPDLVTATGTGDQGSLLDALWDLVWAGEVTNDTLAPLRARVRGGSSRVRGRKPGREVKPRPGALRRQGPPAGAGRWSLVAPLMTIGTTEASGVFGVSTTEIVHARALQLLDRHGILTREAALAENVPGGFAGIYPVLRAMEEAGTLRRGYFVTGLGAAQFALPGAVDRLRSLRPQERDHDDVITLAAADPAQPYGAALPWPDPPTTSGATPADGSEGGGKRRRKRRPARGAGAFVLLEDGLPVAFLERGARSLLTFAPAADPSAAQPSAANAASAMPPEWAVALAALVTRGRLRKIELRKIDGEPSSDSPHAGALRAAGFIDGYHGLTLRS
jgi:ATP-dependent Lhr-like helicase